MQGELEKMDAEDREQSMFDWYNEKSAFVPHYIQIVGLNWMELGGQPMSVWVGDELTSQEGSQIIVDEKALLQKFWRDLCNRDKLVGANIVNFDLAVIKARTAMWGLQATRDFSDIKPWDKDVIDIAAKMNPPGKYLGLKQLRELYAHRLSIPEYYNDILDTTGDSVAKLWANQDIDTLRKYGKLDALTGIEMYKMGNGIFW